MSPWEDSLNCPQFLCEPLGQSWFRTYFWHKVWGFSVGQGIRWEGEQDSKDAGCSLALQAVVPTWLPPPFQPSTPYHFSLYPSLCDLLSQTLQLYSCFTALVFVVVFAWNVLSPDLCLTWLVRSFVSLRTQLKWQSLNDASLDFPILVLLLYLHCFRTITSCLVCFYI